MIIIKPQNRSVFFKKYDWSTLTLYPCLCSLYRVWGTSVRWSIPDLIWAYKCDIAWEQYCNYFIIWTLFLWKSWIPFKCFAYKHTLHQHCVCLKWPVARRVMAMFSNCKKMLSTSSFFETKELVICIDLLLWTQKDFSFNFNTSSSFLSFIYSTFSLNSNASILRWCSCPSAIHMHYAQGQVTWSCPSW